MAKKLMFIQIVDGQMDGSYQEMQKKIQLQLGTIFLD